MQNDLTKLQQEIATFVQERNWQQFHHPKDMAISLALEASELLEVFQWQTDEEVLATKQAKLKEELADVLIYALMFAGELNYDVAALIRQKLALNRQKYPVALAKNSRKKANELTKK